MEQHRGSHNQHSALGGYEVPVALFSAFALGGGQVQGSRQLPAHGRLQFPNHLVQAVREYPRHHVRAAQGVRRLLHRLSELRHSARGPLAWRLSRLDTHGPGQRGIGQIAFGDVVRVADGKHDGREPLPQAGVGVLDCLCLAAEPRLRFQHDAQPIHVRDHIHPPAPGPLFVVRRDSTLCKEVGQHPVLEVFLLTHPPRLLNARCSCVLRPWSPEAPPAALRSHPAHWRAQCSGLQLWPAPRQRPQPPRSLESLPHTHSPSTQAPNRFSKANVKFLRLWS